MDSAVKKRLLQLAIDVRCIRHDSFSEPVRNPADFARLTGMPIERITKTLALRVLPSERTVLAVLPITARLNTSAIATLLSERRAIMLSEQELGARIKQPRHGVSPFANGVDAVLVDQSLTLHESVFVGSGEAGEDLEIETARLITATRAHVTPLVSTS